MGQHRHLRMAWLSHADQSRFPVPRLDPRRTHRARSRALPRPRATQFAAPRPGRSGGVKLLLQVSDDCARPISGARSVHSVDEVEKYAETLEGRRSNHAPGAGVLRLSSRRDKDSGGDSSLSRSISFALSGLRSFSHFAPAASAAGCILPPLWGSGGGPGGEVPEFKEPYLVPSDNPNPGSPRLTARIKVRRPCARTRRIIRRNRSTLYETPHESPSESKMAGKRTGIGRVQRGAVDAGTSFRSR